MAPMKCPAAREPFGDFDDSCTLTHLARRWHVSRREVRHLLQRGALPFVDVRGQIRVPYAAVEEFERKAFLPCGVKGSNRAFGCGPVR